MRMLLKNTLLFAVLSSVPFTAGATVFPPWFLPIARMIMVYDETNWEKALEYYSEDITYRDPIVHLNGLPEVRRHMSNLFRKTKLNLEIVNEAYRNNIYMATWTMTLNWKTFRKVKTIVVEGTTELKFNREGKVYSHRDYYSDADIMKQVLAFAWPVNLFRYFHRKSMKKVDD